MILRVPSRQRSRVARVAFSIALLAAMSVGIPRAAGQSLTLENVMSFPFPDNLAASTLGERVAWTFNIKGVRNVWVADGPDFHDARSVTSYNEDDGRQISDVRLTPDGRTVVFVRGSSLNREGEVLDPDSSVLKPQQEVFAIDVDSGAEPRSLGVLECETEDCEDVEISPDGQMAAWAARRKIWIAPISGSIPAQPIGYVRGQNTNPSWSPNSHEIAFQSNRGDHSFIAIFDFSSRSIRYMQPSYDRDILPRWSHDGSQVAFIRVNGAQVKPLLLPETRLPWSIWVGDPKSGEAHRVWKSGDAADDSFRFSRPLGEYETFQWLAEDRLLFTSEMDGWNHLYSVPAGGGQPVRLTTGQYEVKDVTVSSDGRSVIYSSNDNDLDRRHIWRVTASGGVPVALSQGETIEWAPVETGDGKYTLCLGSDATTPAMPYLLTSSKRRIIAGQLIANYPASQLVIPKQVIYKSLDGLQIHAQLFVPRGPQQPRPAIVWMHGGPSRQMMLGFSDIDYYHYSYAENQYLVSLGFVVMSVNYRMGTMYGRAFRQSPNAGSHGASEYQDIVAAAKYLQAQPDVDPNKIGLWGGSYGGYLTAMGLARNSDIFKAGVDMHGVEDMSVLIGRDQAVQSPDLAEAIKLAWQSSPDESLDKWKSPVLVVQGDDDRNVNFSQSVDFVQRMRQYHVPFEQLVFPDEGHGFKLWKTWMRAFPATADFFTRVLIKGEAIATTN
jgi:dipeptidyl aminopeptidase/acylaminoacyl peptidase